MIAVHAPGAFREAQRRARRMVRQVARGGNRPHAGLVAQLAIHPGQEVHSLEPPVPKQLRIERRHDDPGAMLCGDAGEQLRKMARMLSDPAVCGARLVGPLRPEIDVGSGDPPQFEAARPADLVEFEVPLVPWVPAMPAPHLHRGARIPHQRRHAPFCAGRRHAVGPVRRVHRRARRFRRAVVPLRVEPLRAQGDLIVRPERRPRLCEVRVGEEISEARGRQLLVDAGAPPDARSIGALRQPATHRIAAEQAPVLVPSHHQLQSDALVTGEQREIAVRRRRADDLQLSAVLEATEGGQDVRVHRVKQASEAAKPGLPELHQGQERAVTRRGERGRRLFARGLTLVEEGLELLREGGTRELVRQHGREADRHRRGRALEGQALQLLEQRKVGIDGGFAQPVAAVRPPSVMQHVRQMTVQRENEIHRARSARRGADGERAPVDVQVAGG